MGPGYSRASRTPGRISPGSSDYQQVWDVKTNKQKTWIIWFAELLEIWKDLGVYRKQSKCKIGRNDQLQEEGNIEKNKCNLNSLLGSVVNNVYCT